MKDTEKKMAMLTVGGQPFVVSMENALAVMNAMAGAERLSYDYSSSGYKLAKPDNNPVASVATLSPSQWAVINLNQVEE